MADPIKLVASSIDSVELASLAGKLQIVDPPAMVRLEPDSTTGDPRPGTEARIADPAWMLGRQWQVGELIGEDAGSVVSVRVRSSALPLTAWAPLDDTTVGSPQGALWRPWRAGSVLEELVQDVPALAFERGLRQRAEAGRQLADLLEDAGADDVVAALLTRHPLALDPEPDAPEARLDPQAPRLLSLLAGQVADGVAIAEELVGLAPAEPDWLAGADDAGAVRLVLQEWLAWLFGAPDSGGAWSTERLEYRFALRFGEGGEAVVTRGTQFGSAEVRWSDLEWVPDAVVGSPGGAPDGTPVESTATVLATPLRYPGMPADRYWQLEDGAVDLGAIEAQPHDLAKLALAEFAMSSGDDWLVVPVDALLGGLNRIGSVELTDDFGETVEVGELDDPRFTMFKVAASGGGALQGVLLPPTAAGTVSGAPLEEVLFLRDEQANMAWAIEQTVQGRSGDPRERSAELQPPPDPWPAGLSPEERVYRLQSRVPASWIPLVPIASRAGQVVLRKGAMLRDGEPLLAAGVTLRPTPLTFPGEEIPREGVRVRAVPVLARRADGSYARWASYRVRTGRGEAKSRLAWDSALAITEMRQA
ncbi:hypothetical protein L1785_20660 [Antribacter sp. KLBMP9083]|uniref:Uncharacterized protein n=1 Tax=Antribacter soli TaxID=2910976 RepID=A0AA41QHP0_9MICO|nr:hypothetical protein [Antribacter soli]MCF4123382.1 hypothetical protein [Antribacter soli]